ncbi:hypothetical protein EYF80_000860 [Liparis tanakae]|uniref:Uncharacterized protein n=1 Tax=Liparis tanakae TaxID=230148 RepID=A0A4Z2JI95_9TELE|nr:hypothetical protein EYF80_000860 [Liparis tanakae]
MGEEGAMRIAPVFVLGSVSFPKPPGFGIGRHDPRACLSYISSAATAKPLIYGCLSPVSPPPPLHPTTTTPPTDGL